MRVYYHLEPEGLTYFKTLLDDYNKVQLGVQKILTANKSD